MHPDPMAVAACFVGGGVAVYAVERRLGLRRRESPQFAAMLLDYVPESLALGGMMAVINTGTGLICYIFYERVWARITWGRSGGGNV